MHTELNQLLTEMLEIHRGSLGDKAAWAKTRSMLNSALKLVKEDESQAKKLAKKAVGTLQKMGSYKQGPMLGTLLEPFAQLAMKEGDKVYARPDLETAKELAALRAAVASMHAAKGRHHTQIATCDLYALCGLPFVRPETKPGSTG